MTDLAYTEEPEADDVPAKSDRLNTFAQTPGDISHLLSKDELAKLGMKVVEDYERDDGSRSEWKDKVQNALKYAAQEPTGPKNYPWQHACYSLDTDILTQAGWKPVAEVGIGEMVLSRADDGSAAYYPVTQTHRFNSTSMVHFTGKSIDLLVTPNHRMLVESKSGEPSFIEAAEFIAKPLAWRYIPLTSTWSGDATETVYGIPAKAYARFMGWFISEGWSAFPFVKDKSRRSTGSFGISQSKEAKPENHATIKRDIEACGFTYKEYDRQFIVHARSMPQMMVEDLRATGLQHVREIPKAAMSLPAEHLAEMLDTLIAGDGSVKSRPGRVDSRMYFTTSEVLSGQVQEICQKLGFRASISVRAACMGGVINGRAISGARTGYHVQINTKTRIQVSKLARSLVPYRGEVACVEVQPHHTLYVRRNGKALWCGNSNIQYPMLTVAAQQFAARAMPAIVKGDECVGMKVVGDPPKDVPNPPPPQQPDPNAPPQVQQQQAAQAQQAIAQAQQLFQQHAMLEQKWEAKQSRAKRVKTYLNYIIFYRMEEWEDDMDALLNQIPIVGTAFKKVYYDADLRQTCSEFVPALNLTVPMDTKSLQRCPRITQDFELYPYEIESRQRAGIYRACNISEVDEDEQKPRCILEQHRLEDMDEDGIAEPYIITVDKESNEVLRIEAAFSQDDLVYAKAAGAGVSAGQNDSVPANDAPDIPDLGAEKGQLVSINRWVPYVKFPFLPDPKGRFYGIGFGHLLAPLSGVINTTINELIDAGNAQNAGGGFIASGLRLQGSGQSTVNRFEPGEYKVVSVPGGDLRSAIYERTLPNVSPVLFQLLDLMIGAAKEISSVKDVLTGEASNTAPVGTTLALIDQSLAGFTSIYKRVYRSLKAEYKLIYECEARYGAQYGDVEQYAEILDDPDADFQKDFEQKGHDIIPISDPTVVTKSQAMAKAQLQLQISETPVGQAAGLDPKKIVQAVFDAADIESEGLFLAQPPPNPMMQADVALKTAQAKNQDAQAQLALANAQKSGAEAQAVMPKAVSEGEKNISAADQHKAAGLKHLVDAAVTVEAHPHTVTVLQAQAASHAANAEATLNPPSPPLDPNAQADTAEQA